MDHDSRGDLQKYILQIHELLNDETLASETFQLKSLLNSLLKDPIDLDRARLVCTNGFSPAAADLRALLYKLFLKFLPLHATEWEARIVEARREYETLKEKHIVEPDIVREFRRKAASTSSEAASFDVSTWVAADDHPLHCDESSKWNGYWKDLNLFIEINKDVYRTQSELTVLFEMPIPVKVETEGKNEASASTKGTISEKQCIQSKEKPAKRCVKKEYHRTPSKIASLSKILLVEQNEKLIFMGEDFLNGMKAEFDPSSVDATISPRKGLLCIEEDGLVKLEDFTLLNSIYCGGKQVECCGASNKGDDDAVADDGIADSNEVGDINDGTVKVLDEFTVIEADEVMKEGEDAVMNDKHYKTSNIGGCTIRSAEGCAIKYNECSRVDEEDTCVIKDVKNEINDTDEETNNIEISFIGNYGRTVSNELRALVDNWKASMLNGTEWNPSVEPPTETVDGPLLWSNVSSPEAGTFVHSSKPHLDGMLYTNDELDSFEWLNGTNEFIGQTHRSTEANNRIPLHVPPSTPEKLCDIDNPVGHLDIFCRILFIYAKANPEVRYIQGMNELLAPLYVALASDSTSKDSFEVEVATYFCFSELMKTQADAFIASKDTLPNGILARVAKFDTLLRTKDFELWQHLRNLGVNAEFYALRWILLLLAQEFKVSDVLVMWDALLCDTAIKYPLLYYICYAILKWLRVALLSSDFSVCMRTIQNLPPFDPRYLLQVAQAVRAEDLMYDIGTSCELDMLAANDMTLYKADCRETRGRGNGTRGASSLPWYSYNIVPAIRPGTSQLRSNTMMGSGMNSFFSSREAFTSAMSPQAKSGWGVFKGRRLKRFDSSEADTVGRKMSDRLPSECSSPLFGSEEACINRYSIQLCDIGFDFRLSDELPLEVAPTTSEI